MARGLPSFSGLASPGYDYDDALNQFPTQTSNMVSSPQSPTRQAQEPVFPWSYNASSPNNGSASPSMNPDQARFLRNSATSSGNSSGSGSASPDGGQAAASPSSPLNPNAPEFKPFINPLGDASHHSSPSDTSLNPLGNVSHHASP